MKQKTNLKKIINRGATESALSNSLVPQCLSWICSTLTETRLLCLRTSRLVPFAIRTHFVPSVRKSASALATSKKVAFTLAEGRLACTTTQATAKAAFTLAEVLITLAIIGVVAALTIPSVIQNYTYRMTESKLAKFYSLMNQAILMSKIDNGAPETWDYWVKEALDEEGNYINMSDAIDAAFKKYLAPYLKIVESKEVTDFEGQKRYLYYLADGSAFAYAFSQIRDWEFFPYKAENCITSATRGERVGVCSFPFEFYPGNVSNINTDERWKYLLGKGLEPSMFYWDGDPDSLYEDSTRGCNTAASGSYCTAIIARNGWKIPKDYPRKIKY